MKEFLEPKGITLKTSSAYNPAGNLLAENGIRRVKRAIGNKKMSDAWDDIQALNQSSPYSNEIQSPFEALYGFQPKVIGIPQPDYLNNADPTKRRNHKADRNIDPFGCNKETR